MLSKQVPIKQYNSVIKEFIKMGEEMAKPIVTLSEYNPGWIRDFNEERKRIKGVIGEKAAGIEHIGSTSIKGLRAKPIIAIIIGVEDVNMVTDLVSPLSKIGFEYIPKPEWPERRFFRKGLWGRGTCHLHMVEMNGSEWVEKLLFRDYLRNHPKTAAAYALLKNELAAKYKDDRPTYTRHKEPFIMEIIEKARCLNNR
ncbi:GrpB family protein [Gracilibacillus xinjiangensis]|uniref:GrpB family protein n=1 Tax=Gracilibacillus xinjiangensis TaxID=1193282 RepID=A0ABV8WXT8_9BACI